MPWMAIHPSPLHWCRSYIVYDLWYYRIIDLQDARMASSLVVNTEILFSQYILSNMRLIPICQGFNRIWWYRIINLNHCTLHLFWKQNEGWNIIIVMHTTWFNLYFRFSVFHLTWRVTVALGVHIWCTRAVTACNGFPLQASYWCGKLIFMPWTLTSLHTHALEQKGATVILTSSCICSWL